MLINLVGLRCLRTGESSIVAGCHFQMFWSGRKWSSGGENGFLIWEMLMCLAGSCSDGVKLARAPARVVCAAFRKEALTTGICQSAVNSSLADVRQTLLDSPQHCQNIMQS